MSQIRDVKTRRELEKLWRTEPSLVVDCYTSWCAPCKAMKALLERLAKEYTNVVFVSIDCEKDDFASLTDMMRVQSVPTVFFVSFGRVKRVTTGLVSEATLRKNIRALTEG